MEEYVESMENDSFDLVMRDVWFRNCEKADVVRYRQESRHFEVYSLYEPSDDPSKGMEAMNSLRNIGELLSSEGFSYKVATKRTDGFSKRDLEGLDSDVYFSGSADDNTIFLELDDLFGPSDFLGKAGERK